MAPAPRDGILVVVGARDVDRVVPVADGVEGEGELGFGFSGREGGVEGATETCGVRRGGEGAVEGG